MPRRDNAAAIRTTFLFGHPELGALACVGIALAMSVAGTPATAPEDLASYIPAPESSAWEMDPTNTGPESVASLYGSNTGAIQGFVAAYRKTWDQNDQALSELLESYNSGIWAAFRTGYKKGLAGNSRRHSSFHALTGFPNTAYETTDPPDEQGYSRDTIVFDSGRYIATVSLAAKGTPDAALVMAQAHRQASALPSPGGEYQAMGGWFLAAAAACVLVFLAVVVLIVVLVIRSGRRPKLAPQGLYLSPDGRFYWDGTAWRQIERR